MDSVGNQPSGTNTKFTAQPNKIRYQNKLLETLNRFATGVAGSLSGNGFVNTLTQTVTHPLQARYGKAYEYLVSGDTYRYRDDMATALERYNQALELRPDLTEAHLGMGKCYRRKGELPKALQSFRKALSQTPFSKECHLEIAKAYCDAADLKKSIRHYHRAIQLDPDCLESRFGLGLTLEFDEEWEPAAKTYQDLIDRDPEFLPALNNLGSLYLRLCRFEAAEDTFRQLTRIAPDFPRGFVGLAITLDKSGKKRESLNLYEQVLMMPLSDRSTDFIEKRIASLRDELGTNRAVAGSRPGGNVALKRVK